MRAEIKSNGEIDFYLNLSTAITTQALPHHLPCSACVLRASESKQRTCRDEDRWCPWHRILLRVARQSQSRATTRHDNISSFPKTVNAVLSHIQNAFNTARSAIQNQKNIPQRKTYRFVLTYYAVAYRTDATEWSLSNTKYGYVLLEHECAANNDHTVHVERGIDISKTIRSKRSLLRRSHDTHMEVSTSWPSSLIQIGNGVPQYRLRDTAQSRASLSQLWKRFSLTNEGTLHTTRFPYNTKGWRGWGECTVNSNNELRTFGWLF